MSPIPAPHPESWAWLDADPVLAARVDKYVKDNKLATREAALDHVLRIYLKVR